MSASRLLGMLLATGLVATAAHADRPRIAVTDLTYEEKVVQPYIRIDAREKSSLRASSRERVSESDAASRATARDSVDARHESSFLLESGVEERIDRGEVRKLVADIKGEMIKAGYRVSQPKPYTAKENERIHDVIDRIRKGYFPNADYVLFGTLSSAQFRDEINPVGNGSAYSATLSLEVLAEFSLVNTRTFEVKAGFSALGEGQDVKLLGSRAAKVVLNRGRVMSEASKSLGADVVRQLDEQYRPGEPRSKDATRRYSETRAEKKEQVIIYQ
ncbi:hypothetical protein Tbd_2513 [Thiobacillus denitrificans ATCC 25259]|uniref:Penicillin-binding protein activator LpoB n=1 Tax=Thiobacillus denitrificans (strain ATCC 25259 / T1) TaxID=292415 RepID=Q3SFZ0_THIDA|nr:hypothetical protein [Thiobacillus denitrificans]AAZ98466.1 hypothetical protein Tbd_2513 [Thiobacillus denitrificans ATCC 25259]